MQCKHITTGIGVKAFIYPDTTACKKITEVFSAQEFCALFTGSWKKWKLYERHAWKRSSWNIVIAIQSLQTIVEKSKVLINQIRCRNSNNFHVLENVLDRSPSRIYCHFNQFSCINIDTLIYLLLNAFSVLLHINKWHWLPKDQRWTDFTMLYV